MPELPEVETIVRGLKKAIIDRKIVGVEIKVKKLFIGNSKLLIGKTVENISRIGKNIIIELSNNLVLAIHLKMTGQLIFLKKNQQNKIGNWKLEIDNSNQLVDGLVGGHPDKKYNQPLPHKYTHIVITFTDGSKLYYNDLRKFGNFKLINNSKLRSQNHNLELKIGVDALDSKLSADYLNNICRNRKITIKQLLLDQKVIAGIGNIYSDEILFCAKIIPTKKTDKLNKKEVEKIVFCIPKILRKALKYGGTSKSDYVKLDGSQGRYLDIAYVYAREGERCRVCKTNIKRIKIAQRSSHYCPKCQK